jgi:RNA polymerase sigma factor (TIGR02999 family)
MPGDITRLLADVQGGDRNAQSRLCSLVYEELHRIAGHYMYREQNDSLQPTMLVHDAFLRLVKQDDRSWQNRSQFFATAALTMRRLIVDHARRRNAAKRGGPENYVPLDEVSAMFDERCEEVLAVDEALQRLETFDPRICRIVEMRFFTGMTEEEVAESMGISLRTVKRDWKVARVWLHAELSPN